MKLDILISTANDGIYNVKQLLLSPQKNVTYIISHQIYDGKLYDIQFTRKDVIYKKSYTKGLAKNRNLALSMATGDICLISDDDVTYKKEWLSHIFKAFKTNPDADIITFQIRSNPGESEYKIYPSAPFNHDIRTIFSVSSIEIAFRLEKVKQAGLRFDENFGIGSIFYIGEENIFLIDALKKGFNIIFQPYYVVQHPYRTPSLPITKGEILTHGALFYRILGLLSIFVNLYSIIYNYNFYKGKISIVRYFKLIFRGGLMGYYRYRQDLFSFFSLIHAFRHFIKNLTQKNRIQFK